MFVLFSALTSRSFSSFCCINGCNDKPQIFQAVADQRFASDLNRTECEQMVRRALPSDAWKDRLTEIFAELDKESVTRVTRDENGIKIDITKTNGVFALLIQGTQKASFKPVLKAPELPKAIEATPAVKIEEPSEETKVEKAEEIAVEAKTDSLGETKAS